MPGVLMLTENDRKTRDDPHLAARPAGAAPRKLWDRSQEDSYANPGSPLRRALGSGTEAVRQVGDAIYPGGRGFDAGWRPAVPRPARPEERTEAAPVPERRTVVRDVVGVITTMPRAWSRAARLAAIRRTYYTRDLKANERVALTRYPDPAPQLKGAKAEMVTYSARTACSCARRSTRRRAGRRRRAGCRRCCGRIRASSPIRDTAGQVTGSPYRFTTPGRARCTCCSCSQGYAVIDDATMPIVGAGETANDTYVEQLVASAQAAVDKAVSHGRSSIADRVVVGGHSYGAFMTANLLAHSDIFRAGIARSGAYNRTLTPFGFQNEQRTFWEVPDDLHADVAVLPTPTRSRNRSC